MSAPALWEQQPGESSQAFAAFTTYRDLGTQRSLRAAYEQKKSNDRATKIAGRWTAWSTQWNWVERARAWDAELDRQKREAQVKAAVEANEQLVAMSTAFLNRVSQRLLTMDVDSLTPDNMIRWFVEAAKIRRLAMGEPTEISALEHEIDTEIARCRALLAGAGEADRA